MNTKTGEETLNEMINSASTSYVNPTTKEQLSANLVYLLQEKAKMSTIDLFRLGMTIDASRSAGVRWTFLEKIIPELNAYVRELWVKHQSAGLEEDMKDIETKLKALL